MFSSGTFKALAGAFGAMVLGLVLAVPTPAAASGPVILNVHTTRHGLYENCAGFNVSFAGDLNIHFERYFNDAGQLTLERRHVQFTGTLTNEASGATLPYEGNYIGTLDVSANTLTIEGLMRETVVPGQGVLAIAAGRSIVDATTHALIFESGRTMERYNATICRLLA